MSRLPVIILFFLGIASFTYAQDSVKKAAPPKPAPAKISPYKTYKYHHYYHPKADSAAKARAAAMGTANVDSAVAPAPVVIDKSLNGQYQYLLTKVYHYQQPLISALWKNASDTLNSNRKKLKDATAQLAAQKKITDSLNNEVNGKEQQISSSGADSTDILGVVLPKSTYNLIVWGIIGVLIIVLIVVISRSGGARREAAYRTQLYGELEEEFKTYKTKANDKEKKLARELQTERNKLDELLGRG